MSLFPHTQIDFEQSQLGFGAQVDKYSGECRKTLTSAAISRNEDELEGACETLSFSQMDTYPILEARGIPARKGTLLSPREMIPHPRCMAGE
jgi:hypothetical protein